MTSQVSRLVPMPVTVAGSGTTAQQVQGNAASGTTTAANPVDVSGRYNVTPATFTDGQRAVLQTDNRGDLKVVICASGAALNTVTPSDALAGQFNLPVSSQGQVYDPALATWQRQRGDTNGTYVVGNVASGAADSGNPVKVAGVANSGTPASATTGQRKDLWVQPNGAVTIAAVQATGSDAISNGNLLAIPAAGIGLLPLVTSNFVFNGAAAAASSANTWDRVKGDVNGQVAQLHAMTGSRWQYAAASGGISNTTTAVTIAASAGGALRNYCTGLQISADALGAATEVAVRDGAGGAVLWRGKVTTAGISGVQSVVFEVPLKGTAATLMEVVTLTATITGGVYVNAQGFTGV